MRNRNEDGTCKECGKQLCDCAMVIHTDPPEKIYLTRQDIDELLFHEAEANAYGVGKVETFEYHLAPDALEKANVLIEYQNNVILKLELEIDRLAELTVWHDAKTDPPK